MSKIKKNKESNELQYYKSHCNLLEKENAELKAKIANYEITVSMSGKGVDEKVNDLALLIKKALISKICTKNFVMNINPRLLFWTKK